MYGNYLIAIILFLIVLWVISCLGKTGWEGAAKQNRPKQDKEHQKSEAGDE